MLSDTMSVFCLDAKNAPGAVFFNFIYLYVLLWFQSQNRCAKEVVKSRQDYTYKVHPKRIPNFWTSNTSHEHQTSLWLDVECIEL